MTENIPPALAGALAEAPARVEAPAEARARTGWAGGQ